MVRLDTTLFLDVRVTRWLQMLHYFGGGHVVGLYRTQRGIETGNLCKVPTTISIPNKGSICKIRFCFSKLENQLGAAWAIGITSLIQSRTSSRKPNMLDAI